MIDWFSVQVSSIPTQTPLLLVLSLLISAVGFYRLVYFVSVGYAFSIAAIAVTLVLSLASQLNAFSALHIALLIVYGLRLGIYLLLRERTSTYNSDRPEADRTTRANLPRRVLVWVGVSILYVIMTMPALLHGTGGSGSITVAIVGLVIMAGGLAIEALADKQKSDYKEHFPKRFCDTGLYRLVRCPNYLGEITFWVGNFVAGSPYYTSTLHWVLASAGLTCIVLIMIGSTKRLERSQTQRYGALPEYQEYSRIVPVLFPFVRVYTLQNVRVYLE